MVQISVECAGPQQQSGESHGVYNYKNIFGGLKGMNEETDLS